MERARTRARTDLWQLAVGAMVAVRMARRAAGPMVVPV